MTKKISQASLILQYYVQRPNEPIAHSNAVDWASEEWLKLTGTPFRDPDRAVRSYSQKGILTKVAKGIYMYDPEYKLREDLFDFTQAQKDEILKRDGYRCVVCGRGKAEGVDLQVDHIKAKDKNGKNTIENGQVLCGQHNFIKKNYSQNEAGKRFFIKMKEQAVQVEDQHMIDFCNEVLASYNKFGYDTQITQDVAQPS